MISLRYHIVSIVAVFLAIGLGVLLGSTVLDAAIVDRLESDVERARDARDTAQDEVRSARERITMRDTQLRELAEWMLPDRLADTTVVFVSDGPDQPWQDTVRSAMERAGAEAVGTIRLTERWDRDEAADELAGILDRVAPGSELAERGAAATILEAAGRLHRVALGRALIDALVTSGYLRAEDRSGDTLWPPADSLFVVFAQAERGETNVARLVELTRGLASATATLALTSGQPDGTAVEALRAIEDVPASLSTYDGVEEDPAGLGPVLALEAAMRGAGAHFGLSPERRYVPEPS